MRPPKEVENEIDAALQLSDEARRHVKDGNYTNASWELAAILRATTDPKTRLLLEVASAVLYRAFGG